LEVTHVSSLAGSRARMTQLSFNAELAICAAKHTLNGIFFGFDIIE
jgi:hypothetical protein